MRRSSTWISEDEDQLHPRHLSSSQRVCVHYDVSSGLIWLSTQPQNNKNIEKKHKKKEDGEEELGGAGRACVCPCSCACMD